MWLFCQAFPTDISDTAKLVTTLGAIEADLGPIDALIYNAGNGVWKKYDEVTVDQVSACPAAAVVRWCFDFRFSGLGLRVWG